MIYVNVKSFEQMKIVTDFSGDYVRISEEWFEKYGEDTVVAVDEKYFEYGNRKTAPYIERHIISFEEFSKKYLNGKATLQIGSIESLKLGDLCN